MMLYLIRQQENSENMLSCTSNDGPYLNGIREKKDMNKH